MTKKVNKKRVMSGPGKGAVETPKVEEVDEVKGPLSVYRQERWARLKKKGYVFDEKKNRAVYCDTIAVPEEKDPGFVK